MLWMGYSVFAQPAATAQYRIYALSYKSAGDVEKLLVKMLADRDSKTDIVVDQRRNQLLVQGSERVQEIARQLIESVDRPAVRERKSSKPVVRTYVCSQGDVRSVADKLRALYGRQDGFRVATVPEASQLLVLASPETHQRIALQLSAWGVAGGPPRAVHKSQPESKDPTRRDEPGRQFFRLKNTRVDRIESMLRGLLGTRLRTESADRSNYYFVNSAGREVRFVIDRGRNGLTVSGNPAMRSEFLRLLHMLDSPPQVAGHKVRILPVPRADPDKIKRAVEAYRGDNRKDFRSRPRTDRPENSDDEDKQPERTPASDSQDKGQSQSTRREEIKQAVFQADAAGQPNRRGQSTNRRGQPADGKSPKTDEDARSRGLRELGNDVEIEILPELDIVILRGRDHDVAEVTRIIQELERLSAETQPVIEIYQLKHVRGESLVKIVEKINEELIGGRQGRVSVTPLVKPNALLLIGWGEAIKSIKSLIRKLDQPVSPATQLKVFQLQHAPAATAQATVEEFFSDRSGLGPKVRAVADQRTNSLTVEAAPRDMAEVELLIERLDTGDSRSVNRVRVFQLKNSLAADLGSTLQTAIQAGRGGTGDRKSAALELLTIDAEGERILKSGLLDDVEITPDSRTNSLVISAPAESMPLLEALIRQLDDAAMTSAQIKVFRIINGEASSLVQMLRALLPAQTGASSVPQLPSAEGEVSLAPLRFAVDARTNSIIATGSIGDLQIIEALLVRMDEKDVQQRKSTVYRLKNAPTLDVARAISEFLRSERQVQQAAPGSVSPFLQIESEVIVVPEPVSNSLIISATPRFFDEIMDLVEQLDAQPAQVMIQVLIAELSLDDTDEFGVELGLQDSILFDRSLLDNLVRLTTTMTSPNGVQTTTEKIISQEGTPGFHFNNQQLGNNVSPGPNPSTVGGQGLSSFAVGRVNNELGFGGLVLSASSESVSILVRALEESRRLEVLSRPQIMTLDNQPAFIQVGERVPRIIGSQINQVGQVNNIALENVGLILGVTPRISPDGMVVMEIDAEKSELGPEAEGIPISVSVDGSIIRSPRISLTNAQTTVSTASGETIVLGGLITKASSQVSRRVPWLADIPLLGSLFRYDSVITRRKELLIIMTPQVVRNQEDAERLKYAESARMHWCTADVHELHGDGSFCTNGSCPICDTETMVIYPDLNPRGSFPMRSRAGENTFPPAPAPAPGAPAPAPGAAAPAPGAAAPAPGAAGETHEEDKKSRPRTVPLRLRILGDEGRLDEPDTEKTGLSSEPPPPASAPEPEPQKTRRKKKLLWW